MALIPQAKCPRCDRKYSGLRTKCPYCGARRYTKSNRSAETDNSLWKIIIGILLLVVLIVAVVVLIVTSNEPADTPPVVNPTETPGIHTETPGPTTSPVPTVTYTVTYNSNGATGGTAPVDSAHHESGSSVTVLGNTGNLVRTGYTFSGWNTAANGSGTAYSAGGSFKISANVTLYAQWTEDSTPGPIVAQSVVIWYGSARLGAAFYNQTYNCYEISMKQGESLNITYRVTPNGVASTAVWDTTNSDVLVVTQSGKLSAVGAGNAYVTCTVDGITDRVLVHVRAG